MAETSLTIDGVRTVIDSGLARIASFEPRRGINTLLIKKISRAAAEQRAGRAGRTAPGRAFRLWSEADHARRAEFEAPEVHRVDLAEAVLLLKAAGVSEIRDFRWFDAPTEESLSRAERLLHDLGALDLSGQLTEEGAKMASLPLEPRFSRLMLAGYEHGCVAETAFIAATVQGEGIFTNKRGGVGRKDFIFADDDSDFAGEWRAFESAEAMGFDPRRCDQVGVMARGARETAQGFDRLCSMAKRFGWDWQPVDFKARREAVGKAMLASFSDQLAIRISQGTLACKLVGNRKGKLDEESCVRNAPAFVAAEITEVEAREIIVHLRRATAIDPAWLAELFPEDLTLTDGAAWDETRRRVVARKETRFRDLVLEAKESDHGVNLDQAAELLAARVLSGELDVEKLGSLRRAMDRAACAVRQVDAGAGNARLVGRGPDGCDRADLPRLGELQGNQGSQRLARAARMAEPRRSGRRWMRIARSGWICRTASPQRSPTATDKDPFISVRVSHLFGMWETPTIASGRVPLLVHILTPGQKPWQMTKDLKGFWAVRLRPDEEGSRRPLSAASMAG